MATFDKPHSELFQIAQCQIQLDHDTSNGPQPKQRASQSSPWPGKEEVNGPVIIRKLMEVLAEILRIML